MTEINSLTTTDTGTMAGARLFQNMVVRGLRDMIDAPLSTSAGTTPHFTFTPLRQNAAYYEGLSYRLKFHATNATSPTTVAPIVGGTTLTAVTLVDPNGSAVGAQWIAAGAIVDIVHDGTNFQVVSWLPTPPG